MRPLVIGVTSGAWRISSCVNRERQRHLWEVRLAPALGVKGAHEGQRGAFGRLNHLESLENDGVVTIISGKEKCVG